MIKILSIFIAKSKDPDWRKDTSQPCCGDVLCRIGHFDDQKLAVAKAISEITKVYSKISRTLPNITDDYRRISESDIENFEHHKIFIKVTITFGKQGGTKYTLRLMHKLTV